MTTKTEDPDKILLVDDRSENLLGLEVILANKNYELIRANTGKEALRILLNEQNFALILMDAMMPIMDGYETAELIRQNEKVKYIPIIFLTAQLNTPDNIFKGYQSGGVDYMLKPLSSEILKAKVAVFVDLYRKNKELVFQIEERNKAEREKLVAQEATKSKQQFLSNMSHEIRTPLNSILGFTNVLMKSGLGEQQKVFVQAIKTSSNSLLVLINDILDLAKVDAGKMTFVKQPFDIRKSIQSILNSFDLKLKEKNLELVNEYDSKIPSILLGDSVRLNQIILNLMSNAIKFTHKGKITLSVKILNQHKENVTVEFAVTDTGIGIAENKIHSIFNHFEQAEFSTSNSYGGTGLGLAIVKQLIEFQGGSISVSSMIGEGSTFSFIMPFEKSNLKVEADIKIPTPDLKIKNLRILVAEDVALNQLLIKLILGDFGFEHDVVNNGKIAIEKLQTNTYDLILMDLHMPEMNGFDATEYIRKTIKSNIPIIALTADVTTMDVAKCKEFGMDDYISKPIDENLLYIKIVELVKKEQ